ncbi:DUF1365 domain-containing protein [Meridianimarinicoccus aquatilis]|uniref:DUF1365 domain-containing protein n=1 Tax=Meridianimarinicoccus aquatilis TaxID=2552766 RepID=A0A4R6AT59_9RHOB|nr:DUF1365 domain-containing protein [Fluviibacterium aquatile]TDL85336.1 DUF1365 domain-containing protein [Fluviibacterium aquatile]
MDTRVDHIVGQTFHGREGGIENAFRYSVDYCLLDPETARGPSLFSRNTRNLTSLHDTDHGGAPGQGRGSAWVREVLDAHQLDKCDGPILLLAQPRVLGHVFNPVSFWLCHGKDESLRAVIAEVSNTFGDRHSYLCHHVDQRPITRHERLSSRKIFHVSPFQPVEGDYTFRFDLRADRVGVWIDFRSGEERLYATLTGRRKPLTNRAILWAALRRPLGSRRVLGLIHWQALVLWWKGARWHARPEPPTEDVSR